MKEIKVLIAGSSYLFRKGLCSLINNNKEFSLVGDAQRAEDLSEKLLLYKPDVLIIDYTFPYFCMDDIAVIRQCYPQVNMLAITYPQSKSMLVNAIASGVVSHLLKDCRQDEIIEAIYSTSKRQMFLCDKVLDILLHEPKLLHQVKSPVAVHTVQNS